LKVPAFIPAAAQGVLAFQVRSDDAEMKEICRLLDDSESHKLTQIERKFLHDFMGGCQVPLGVYAKREMDAIHIWISFSDAWNRLPRRTHFAIGEHEAVETASVVRQMKAVAPASVFVSSDLNEDDYLVRVLKAAGFQIACESLIAFRPVDFEIPGKADWLFFSSKNGVKHYFEKAASSVNQTTKLAAINNGTAEAIARLGYAVDFIGAGSDLRMIAKTFDARASGIIVFPQAQRSMQSIQKNMLKNQDTRTLVVYENYPKQDIAERTEQILVFTSPMSVQAYFAKHYLKAGQFVVSIGRTTTAKLRDFHIRAVKTAYEPSQWCLADEVFSLHV
jgi:uroporphyrinogen-III synthase